MTSALRPTGRTMALHLRTWHGFRMERRNEYLWQDETGNDVTIVFDLGNVLIRWDPRAAFRHAFDDDAAVDALFDEIGFHDWHHLQDCGRSRADAVAAIAGNWPQYTDLMDGFFDRFGLTIRDKIPGSWEIVAELRDRGHAVWVLTNWGRIPGARRCRYIPNWARCSRASWSRAMKVLPSPTAGSSICFARGPGPHPGTVFSPMTAAISARICWRSTSMGTVLPSRLEAPVGPAIAGRRAFEMRTDLVDRALDVAADQRAVGADLGLVALVHGIKLLSGAQHATFDQLPEGHARLGALGGRDMQRLAVISAHPGQAFLGDLAVSPLRVRSRCNRGPASWPRPRSCRCRRTDRARHRRDWSSRPGRGAAGFGLLRGMRLVAGLVLEPLMPGADRQHPVRAHLYPVIERFERLVVEGVARALFLAGPDHRLMRVGKALAAEIRHRVGFAPHHVVEDPEPGILQRGARRGRCCDRIR